MFSCDKFSKVTIYQIDWKHQKAHGNKIKNYNMEDCKLETEPVESVPLSDLHGGFCLFPIDAGKWQADAKTECKSEKEKRNELKRNADDARGEKETSL